MSKNATPSDNSDGQDESIDHSLQTDGGVSRRVFLGAAAALSTLSAVGGTAAAEGIDSGENTATTNESTEYGATTAVTTVGGLEVWTEGNRSTDVTVSSHPEGVSLSLSNDRGRMNVMLLPEDIEALCAELARAKGNLVEEDVAESREWITEDYRDGDA